MEIVASSSVMVLACQSRDLFHNVGHVHHAIVHHIDGFDRHTRDIAPDLVELVGYLRAQKHRIGIGCHCVGFSHTVRFELVFEIFLFRFLIEFFDKHAGGRTACT